MVRTGAFGYLQYGFEMCFGTAAGTIDTVFGLEQKITNWSLTNNRITLAALNQIEPQVYAYGTTRGSLGVDFVLSNPFWLSTLYCMVATDACMPTAGSHTHTYTNPCKLRQPISIQVGVCGTIDLVRTLTGGVVNSIALRSSIGEVVRGSADITYANEVEGCAIDACPACDADNFPYTFAYGTLTTSGACTLANLQSFDITMSQNSDLLYTHNTSVADDAYRRLFEITGSFTASYVDNELLRNLYAQAHCSSGTGLDAEAFLREQLTLTIVFDNGQTGIGAEKTITLTGSGVGFADHAVSIEPNEPIFETLNWQVRTLAPVAVNQTAAAPMCA